MLELSAFAVTLRIGIRAAKLSPHVKSNGKVKELWTKLTLVVNNLRLQQDLKARYSKIRSEALRSLEAINAGDTPEELPYWQQGNTDMYSEESLRQRNLLKRDAAVRAAIERWWAILSKDGASCSKEAYIHVNLIIHKALVPSFDEIEARESAEEDWEKDAQGADQLSFEQFFASLFELADVWCERILSEEYVAFLDVLLRKVTEDGSWPPSSFRDIEAVDVAVADDDGGSEDVSEDEEEDWAVVGDEAGEQVKPLSKTGKQAKPRKSNGQNPKSQKQLSSPRRSHYQQTSTASRDRETEAHQTRYRPARVKPAPPPQPSPYTSDLSVSKSSLVPSPRVERSPRRPPQPEAEVSKRSTDKPETKPPPKREERSDSLDDIFASMATSDDNTTDNSGQWKIVGALHHDDRHLLDFGGYDDDAQKRSKTDNTTADRTSRKRASRRDRNLQLVDALLPLAKSDDDDSDKPYNCWSLVKRRTIGTEAPATASLQAAQKSWDTLFSTLKRDEMKKLVSMVSIYSTPRSRVGTGAIPSETITQQASGSQSARKATDHPHHLPALHKNHHHAHNDKDVRVAKVGGHMKQEPTLHKAGMRAGTVRKQARVEPRGDPRRAAGGAKDVVSADRRRLEKLLPPK